MANYGGTSAATATATGTPGVSRLPAHRRLDWTLGNIIEKFYRKLCRSGAERSSVQKQPTSI
ncbi:uncharacterized protein Dyak_GE27482 [Drosophila yakuba]|uniref:Uncharacterized protein n=1 Tax=Drosophila yakuba TaxID=7245 RepID=A0A0R1E6T1_DROYA|nr:uncharacterized protein Dyak_GE27482 [Drosophila yakuba]